MQPKIIKLDKLFITGRTGDGSQTLAVWTEFDNRYNTAPFPKANETGYEIRFWQSRVSKKVPDAGKSVHVGFQTDGAIDAGEFTSIELPMSEYAVFEVCVANGYDIGMRKWKNGLRTIKQYTGCVNLTA